MNQNPVPTAFEHLFRDLVQAFQPRHLERGTCGVYWAVLGSVFPLATLRQAALTLARTQRFFPTTGEWALAASNADIRVDPVRGERCEWCANRGVVCIRYHSGEPFDIAICQCQAAHMFRQIGDDALGLVRRRLALDAMHDVGWIEDFGVLEAGERRREPLTQVDA